MGRRWIGNPLREGIRAAGRRHLTMERESARPERRAHDDPLPRDQDRTPRQGDRHARRPVAVGRRHGIRAALRQGDGGSTDVPRACHRSAPWGDRDPRRLPLRIPRPLPAERKTRCGDPWRRDRRPSRDGSRVLRPPGPLRVDPVHL